MSSVLIFSFAMTFFAGIGMGAALMSLYDMKIDKELRDKITKSFNGDK